MESGLRNQAGFFLWGGIGIVNRVTYLRRAYRILRVDLMYCREWFIILQVNKMIETCMKVNGNGGIGAKLWLL